MLRLASDVEAAGIEPVMIVVDTQGPSIAGRNENAASDKDREIPDSRGGYPRYSAPRFNA